ncbi:MAG: hypothetical protein MI861_17870, partial [Pirellulales bacterium]|nr:hypothetical protein [Pirellulales bacterium]
NGDLVGEPCYDFLARGFTWDVAITRGTALLPLPVQPGQPTPQLMFYDGGECVRNLDEHNAAVKRPRGYSCEELGGLAWLPNEDLHQVRRISINHPQFVSPHGTGCSRYVDVLATSDGYYATWQQGQSDQSQPLVMNFVPRQRIEAILAG